MDARFYNSDDIDIERLGSDIVNVYQAQGYQAQQIGSKDQQLIQLKKGGDFEAIIGMQAALTLTLQHTANGTLAMIGKQRWIDKAAVGAVGIVALPILWPLALTAGVGAFRQASLGNQILNITDGLVRQQRPGVQLGPLPMQIVPQIQQQWAPPSLPPPTYYEPSVPVYIPPAQVVVSQVLPSPGSTSTQLRCTQCNTPYEPGDTFCSGCGRPLTTPRLYCSNCNLEVKTGSAFCPRCGASTFSTIAASQQSTPKPTPAPVQPTITYTASAPTPAQQYTPPAPQTPVYTPPPTPVYTPPTPKPAPQTPVYTPPPVSTPPPAPVYTPPTPSTPTSVPQPTVYYTPSAQPSVDPVAPTQPTPSRPTEPYYVPPVTQEPTLPAQPRVHIVTNTPKQEPPQPKPRPQKQYYIPSNPDDPTIADMPAPTSQSQVAQPAAAAGTLWGRLLFGDVQQIELSGERAVIGRYDHDIGGEEPEVDLSRVPGSDTVSRVHAVLEHIDSSYMLTDLNSTNATRINSKRLEPDKPTPIKDGDTLNFGKVVCTFHKA